jgi:D-alanyl-D-alanine carboxypeptidase
MIYFIIVIMLYKIIFWPVMNRKKLGSIAMLIVFFVFSSSFCAPFMNLAQKAMDETTSVVETDSVSMTVNNKSSNQNVQKQYSDILNGQSTETSDGDAEMIGDADKYSIDEILENNKYSDAAQSSQETTEENDAADMSVFHKNDWNLLLINKQHPIPDDYKFDLGMITGSLECDKRVIPDLLSMLKQAKTDGISLVICSPYRSMNHQENLFTRKIDNYMKEGLSYMDSYKLSSQAVTIPGSSEHQVGLAVDIYSNSYKKLDASFGDTQAGQWLAQHCSEYGFILRYPKGKEDITGIEYEPWHFRYVGKGAAKVIMDKGITLEEFIESL